LGTQDYHDLQVDEERAAMPTMSQSIHQHIFQATPHGGQGGSGAGAGGLAGADRRGPTHVHQHQRPPHHTGGRGGGPPPGANEFEQLQYGLNASRGRGGGNRRRR
jgi:hypothetical protein